MKLDDSHGGLVGRSIVEVIEDDLEEALKIHFEYICKSDGDANANVGYEFFAEGIAQALGRLRSTDADIEWERGAERIKNPNSKTVEREISRLNASARVQRNTIDSLKEKYRGG